MGGGSWSPMAYSTYATTKGLVDKAGVATNMSAHEIFKSRELNQALDPKDVKIRESCDSAEHPNSNAIILGLDVTGSMGFIAKTMAQKGLPTLMKEIYDRKPVEDPQIMFMGLDDIEMGGHFQVSQFESDIRIAEQLEQLWLEGGGGGNHYESYTLPWFFASQHTSIDCFEKRKKKGYLFTIGDEELNPHLPPAAMQQILGYKPQVSLNTKDLLKAVRKKYEVFHIIVDEGNYARSNKHEVHASWEEALGDNAIHLPNHTKLAEVIVSAIQVSEGQNQEDVAKSWDKDTAAIVAQAVKGLKRVVEI